MAGSDEILAERRVRSSELALEAARRRLREAEGELFDLHRRVAQLEAGLLEREDQLAAEIASLQSELETERRARRRAVQIAHAEQARRHELEEELSERMPPAVEGVERELGAAQRRIRELEAETELIRRHATEFQHRVGIAVDQAWEWMTDLGARIGLALEQLGELQGRMAPGELEERAGPAGPVEAPEARRSDEELAAERLDAALARLRGPREEPPEPRRRWWSGRP